VQKHDSDICINPCADCKAYYSTLILFDVLVLDGFCAIIYFIFWRDVEVTAELVLSFYLIVQSPLLIVWLSWSLACTPSCMKLMPEQ